MRTGICRGTLLALVAMAGSALANSSLQAAAAAQRQAIGQQQWQQIMMNTHNRMIVYAPENLEADVSGYFTLYGEWGSKEGYGALQTEKASFLRGMPRRSVILLAKERYLPGLTDSVRFTDASGESRTGVPYGETWLFLERTGRIKLFSRAPGMEITHYSIADSDLVEFDKDPVRLRKELETVPMAGYFGAASGQQAATRTPGRSDTDLDLAVRIYNTLYGKRPAPEKPRPVSDAWVSAFGMDSISDYAYSQIKITDPDDFMQKSVRARYLCGIGDVAKAEPLLAEIDALIPELYFTYLARALCAQTSGKSQEALRLYRMAYKTAPSGVADRYYSRIRRYQKALGEIK